VVNGLIQYQPLFTQLAKRIAAAIPSLNGYVGVDVIVDNADVYVVEINPRITTSYIGLRESIGLNPAQLILDLACCELSNNTFALPLNMMNKPVKISLNA
jgi:predicted ATP-grasp superfamily ATP-dependent carboligase